MYNAEMLKKMVQSIRKNAIFGTFFRFFWILDILKSPKKRVNGPKKNEHKRFFLCFQKNESICGLEILKTENTRFLKSIFGPF